VFIRQPPPTVDNLARRVECPGFIGCSAQGVGFRVKSRAARRLEGVHAAKKERKRERDDRLEGVHEAATLDGASVVDDAVVHRLLLLVHPEDGSRGDVRVHLCECVSVLVCARVRVWGYGLGRAGGAHSPASAQEEGHREG